MSVLTVPEADVWELIHKYERLISETEALIDQETSGSSSFWRLTGLSSAYRDTLKDLQELLP